jgi:hypothetical protein
MRSKLEIAFELDRRWRLLRGEMDGSKRAALIELARILAEARVPYAVLDGVALQIHQRGGDRSAFRTSPTRTAWWRQTRPFSTA